MLTTTTTTGSLIPLTPIILFKQQNLGICMTKSSYDVPSTTKTMVLQVTSTLFRWPMPHQPILEHPTTSQCFHVV
jgi:hypothetical protein